MNRLLFFLIRHTIWRIFPPEYVILLGGPGAGKDTMAVDLAPARKITHVSTGNLFRREIELGTDIGKQVEPIVKSGKGLVSDEIVFTLLLRELTHPRNWRGALINGFPRTPEQAEMLIKLGRKWGVTLKKVVVLEVPLPDLVERLSLRLTCRACGKTYHQKFKPAPANGRCACGGELYQRDDDKPGPIEDRMVSFNTKSKPVFEIFRRLGKLAVVTSTNDMTPDAVRQKVMEEIDK